MPKIFNDIEGWFDFDNLYDEMVDKFKTGGHFVECGCWLGRSSVYLLEKIIETGANIHVDFIDTWEGDPDVPYQQERIQEMTLTGFYDQFVANIKRVDPDLQHCSIIKANSLDAVGQYDDTSLDFVFLDDAHYYEQIASEIPEWLVKVKVGGVLGGHDYGQAGVDRAVSEFLDTPSHKPPNSWYYNKTQLFFLPKGK